MQQLYGLRYDFEHRNGTCLVFCRAGEGIQEEELSRIQTKMLQMGQIPRLLPFDAEFIDGAVKLVYEIGPRRMLQQAWRTERFTLSVALQFLVAVTAMLEECRSYMLREEGFLLGESFLFVNSDITDVSFVYLPLPRTAEAPSVEQELKRLIERVSEQLPAEEGPSLAMFAAYCESGAFRVKELKRRLIEMLTSKPFTAGDEPHSENREAALKGGPAFADRHSSAASIAEPARFDAGKDEQLRASLEPLTNTGAIVGEGLTRDSSAIRKLLSIGAAAVGIISAVWLWNRYIDAPSTALLQAAVGTTVLFAAVWLMLRYAVDDTQLRDIVPSWVLRRKRPVSQRKQQRQQQRIKLPLSDVWDGEFDCDDDSNVSEFAYLTAKSAQAAHLDMNLPAAERALGGVSGLITADGYYASLREQTSLLRPVADATVLLRPNVLPQPVRPQAFLETCGEHPPQSIALSRESFVIGRSGEHTDYRLEAADVSRQHVEIVADNDAYAAKDLGSTNGTLWNGERMVPFRTYPLQEGDCLKVAQTELRFRFVANTRKTV